MTQLQALYVAYFGRPADAGGIAFWQARSESEGLDASAVGEALYESAEARARYPDEAPEALVDRVYANILGRSPDTTGRAFWIEELESGRLDAARLPLTVFNAVRGGDADHLDNRIAAADVFTDQAVATDYIGQPAAAVARDWLDGIDADASSLTLASNSLAGLFTRISDGAVTGHALDGYISGADVYVDTNGNGVAEASEQQ
ncbi:MULTISPECIES: DUF4214 domain-containing protein [Spiribacter]|uniref:DUF4214 domain-containing protein n=1 Tax=Spiribacter TaxID=1335745 RepID=UPI00132F7464|nr:MULTISPECIES: DUF4214 domain-containing protein [Spiribacter]